MTEPKMNDGWFHCPHCGKKQFKVSPEARASGIELKCKNCKQIIEVNIEPLSQTCGK